MPSGAQRRSRKAAAIARAEERETPNPIRGLAFAAEGKAESDGTETAPMTASLPESPEVAPTAASLLESPKFFSREHDSPTLAPVLLGSPSVGPKSLGSPWLDPRTDPCPVRLSSESWYEKGAEVEDEAPPQKDKAPSQKAKAPRADAGSAPFEKTEFITDVKPHIPQTRENPRLAALLEQARVLSDDCFLENCLEGCSKRGGWRITLLASQQEDFTDDVLLGFIVWKIKEAHDCMSISKLAVPKAYRSHGYGRQIVVWAVQFAKKQPEVDCLSLSSLPNAISFYLRLGFRKMHEISPEDENDDDAAFSPGQWYMEYKTKGRGGRKRR